MEGDDRTWIVPNTAKLTPLDIVMPTVRTTLPGGLVVTFKAPEQIDPETIERYIEIYRVSCFGTKFETFGFAAILNEVLVSPLSTVEVEENREVLHNLFIPILDSLDDRKWGSKMVTRPYDELEHENSIFAGFWRSWGIAVRSAMAQGYIDDGVSPSKMSNLLVEYAGSPEVLYRWYRRPEGEMVALPIWVRHWFHHTENAYEPTPPSRHEIRRAARELLKLSLALEMTKDGRRAETHREQIGGTTRIEYQWLNMQVYVDEGRNEITVCQLGVFDGWSIKRPYSDFHESGEELVDFALRLKQKAQFKRT